MAAVFLAKDMGLANAGGDGGEEEWFIATGEGELRAEVVEGAGDFGGEDGEIARAGEASKDLIAIGDLEKTVAAGRFKAELVRGGKLEGDLLTRGLTGGVVAGFDEGSGTDIEGAEAAITGSHILEKSDGFHGSSVLLFLERVYQRPRRRPGETATPTEGRA